MLWIVVAMGVLTHLPIRQVFKHARRLVGSAKTPGRSSLCEGRQRLGVEAVRRVFEQVVRPLAAPMTPGAFYRGLRLMGLDGTVQDVPDTPANELRFGRSTVRLIGLDGTVQDVPDTPANELRFGRSTGGRGDGAFPQLRKVSLVELGTHVEVAFALGAYHDSEHRLVEHLWDRIPAGAMVIEDRGLFSYNNWKTLDSRGVKLLIRIPSNLVLRPSRCWADGSYEAKIYLSSCDRDRNRNGVVVRVIEFTASLS